MPEDNPNKEWREYCDRELEAVTPILAAHGFKLNDKQPLIGGEKYLMQAVTTSSGKKLVLLGEKIKDNMNVVIKVSSDPDGSKEIEHERIRRDALKKIGFAYNVFFTPEEILFTQQDGFTISVQEFIPQESPFLARPIKEQFTLTIEAFKAQESAHAATHEHLRRIQKTFGHKSAKDYLETFASFISRITTLLPEETEIHDLLAHAEEFLKKHSKTIEQYEGFLTHTDFVPHNFRVRNGDIYLIDHSSIHFGNKHEGWARFINYMTLHNPALEEALLTYVRQNRAPEEVLSLKLMRIYRLGEIIFYYANTLTRSSGDLYTLNRARVNLWSNVLRSVLENKTMNENLLREYRSLRDSLRSEDELLRQQNLE